LQDTYNKLEVRHKELVDAELVGQDSPIMSLDVKRLQQPDVRRVLLLYANDISEKLHVFDKMYQKIRLFDSLIRDYFSRKEVKITRNCITITSTVTGKTLDATSLSSGEQHIFVLFFRLIFGEPGGNRLVLIDEPELSLHPRWQLRFVDDLERIRSVSPLDFVLASHSPQILQGHIDLARDLNI
jgi:predicted ATPase